MPKVFERPQPAGQHCRHYSYEPGLKGGPRCALGVELVEPLATLTCMPPPIDERVQPCAKREEHTEEERAAWKAWREESMQRMIKIMPLIPGSGDRKKRDQWGKGGEFDCPCCEGGKVRWVRASINGHVHAACSTKFCFAVMQ